jgi:TPR repeat protein
VRWWQNAAKRGHVGAKVRLGTACYLGVGAEVDGKRAMLLWYEAAMEHSAEAKIYLAMM